MRALRRAVKILPKFVCQDQRSKVNVTSDKKNEKLQQAATGDTVGIMRHSKHDFAPLSHADGGYAGGKISACCLVFRFVMVALCNRADHYIFAL